MPKRPSTPITQVRHAGRLLEPRRRRSTLSSWRSTRISTSLLASVRARSTSSATSRRASRYTSEKITTGILPDLANRVTATWTAGYDAEPRFSAPTSKFTDIFDAVFASEDIHILRTPVRAPQGERDRRTMDRHRLPRTAGPDADPQPPPPPARAGRVRGALQRPSPPSRTAPSSTTQVTTTAWSPPQPHPRRRDRLGGLIHEYTQFV